MYLIFDHTQANWVFVVVFSIVFYSILWIPFILKQLKISKWLARKSGHIVLHTTLALLPFWLTNLFDFVVTVVILLALVIITSFIPQIRMITKVFEGNLREGEKNCFYL